MYCLKYSIKSLAFLNELVLHVFVRVLVKEKQSVFALLLILLLQYNNR